jgi:hypothetical protein
MNGKCILNKNHCFTGTSSCDNETVVEGKCSYFVLSEDLICPFCGETDFDEIGLKHHLIEYCEKYNLVETLNHWRNYGQR